MSTTVELLVQQLCSVGRPVLAAESGWGGADPWTLLLQEALEAGGYPPSDGKVDGIFGPATEAAVRAFRIDHGLGDDGTVTDEVWDALAWVLSPVSPAVEPTTAPWEGEQLAPRFAGDDHLEAIDAGRELMSYGWYGCAVKKIQQALIEAGCDLSRYGVDGDFKAECQAAVEAFQASCGIKVDGIVGRITLRTLQGVVPPEPAVPVNCGGGIEVHVEPGSGTLGVVAFLGDAPVAEAAVRARCLEDPTERVGRTDEFGRHDFGEVRAGRYVVSAEKASLVPASATVLLSPGEDHQVVLRMARQGETERPAVYGVRPLSARGFGEEFFSSPHDAFLGKTKPQMAQQATAAARRSAQQQLGTAIDKEEATLRARHSDRELRFETQNYAEECTDPDWTVEANEGTGPGTIVVEKVTVWCEASVHLVYRSTDERVD